MIRAPFEGSATYYSPWFPRMGTRATFGCNVVAASPGVDSFEIQVQTKRSEDDNREESIENVGAAEDISTLSADSVEVFQRGNSLAGADGPTTWGFRDLIRFKYTLQSKETGRAWLCMRMLAPSWETD